MPTVLMVVLAFVVAIVANMFIPKKLKIIVQVASTLLTAVLIALYLGLFGIDILQPAMTAFPWLANVFGIAIGLLGGFALANLLRTIGKTVGIPIP